MKIAVVHWTPPSWPNPRWCLLVVHCAQHQFLRWAQAQLPFAGCRAGTWIATDIMATWQTSTQTHQMILVYVDLLKRPLKLWNVQLWPKRQSGATSIPVVYLVPNSTLSSLGKYGWPSAMSHQQPDIRMLVWTQKSSMPENSSQKRNAYITKLNALLCIYIYTIIHICVLSIRYIIYSYRNYIYIYIFICFKL